MEETKDQFGRNLVALRKQKGLTQSQLAEKLNYSDKTVSKWENGDALPDTPTLYELSKFFDVSMDCLYKGDLVQNQENTSKQKNRVKVNKFIISLLAVLVVWTVAVFVYVQAKIFDNANLWILFVWAIPASCIVLLVFNSIWGRRKLNYLIISALIWTLILSIHLQILPINNVWAIYFLGIPLQIAVLLWSQLIRLNRS